MADTGDADRKEMVVLMREGELTQRDLSELLGTNAMTVNRWLSDREYDTRPPPFYALQFLRMYVMLPEAMRVRLLRRTADAKKKAPEETPQSPPAP